MFRPLLLSLAALFVAEASPAGVPAEWSHPTTPFRIVGPVYYVGTRGIAVYLVHTSEGLILLDGGLEENVGSVESSIAELGFDLHDVKLIIATHAHYDHAAGLAELKRDTGAEFASSPGDRTAYETGLPPSELSYGIIRFPSLTVERELRDGQPVRLGGVSMTPLFTAGHTPGCTSWTMRVIEQKRSLDVAFPCSMTVAGNKLVGNQGYPGIVRDYRDTFERIRQIDADVVLPSHPELADVLGRKDRRDEGDTEAFVAPMLLTSLVDEAEAAFEKKLKEEISQ